MHKSMDNNSCCSNMNLQNQKLMHIGVKIELLGCVKLISGNLVHDLYWNSAAPPTLIYFNKGALHFYSFSSICLCNTDNLHHSVDFKFR